MSKPKPAFSSAPRSSPRPETKATSPATAPFSITRHSTGTRPEGSSPPPTATSTPTKNKRPPRFAPVAALKRKPAAPNRDYEDRTRYFSRNTLHDLNLKNPTPEELDSHTGRPTPGINLRFHKIIRGDPRSFPGKKAICIPGGWNDLGKGHRAEKKFVFCSHLLVGPLENQTTPRRRNFRLDTMANYVQVAATPTADTGAALLLHFDHRRYLFGNLSEGTQRALNQRKLAVAKLETLFISGETKWENTGGMIGMMLTIADVQDGSRREIMARNEANKRAGRKELSAKGPERIEIHGARNLNYSIATARTFVFRKGLPIRAVELYEDPRLTNPEASTPDWEDDAIQVWKVPVFAPDDFTSPLNESRKRSHELMTAEDEALQTRASADSASDVQATAKKHDVVDAVVRYVAREKSASVEEEEAKKRDALEAIVGDMFSSDWTMDKLYETKLSQVQLPATIFVKEDGQIQKYNGPLPGDKGKVPDIEVLVRYPWPAATVQSLPPVPRSNSATCYVVKNRGRRGKFNPVIAKELGVDPPNFKHLAAGRTVVGKTGNEVTPDMVLGERLKPVGFAVIDIANTSFIESFLGRSEWQNQTLMESVPIFYWVLGQSVIDDPRIQNFIKERPGVKHVIMAPDACPNMVAMESYALLHAKLRRIDPDRFPVLNYDNTVRDLSHLGPNVEAARVGMKAVLGAGFEAKKDEIVPFPTFKEVDGIDRKALRLSQTAAAKIREPSFLEEVERAEQDIPNRDTEIIPLGTGSALPSKYRNVSSTLIRVPQYGTYVLDCGENTLGQLRRAYPAEEVTKILQETRCIFISHMHADHQLGTARFIRAWADATAHLDPPPTLAIAGTNAMRPFLLEYDRVESVVYKRLRFLRHDHLFPHNEGRLPADCPTRLASFQLVRVSHCQNAYAGVFTWPSGLKIAYSGDCRPSDKFVEAAKGATLLIHESTFDDDKMGDALAKKHSTMSEALDVGYRMGARRVLLTHFSQRYAKLPLVEKRTTPSGDDQAVLMAFDQMRVKLGEFRQAQAFLPAIRRFFDTDDPKAEEDE
ncbi:metallo-beta-lactamase superfamily protein [Colletotrichum cereale]|nr:metallo-beta-lactamase superfamily protein [Colletotrichum cereale]